MKGIRSCLTFILYLAFAGMVFTAMMVLGVIAKLSGY